MLLRNTLAMLPVMTGIYANAQYPDFQVIVEKGTPTSDVQGVELEAAKRVLAFLKGKIGGDEIQALLADDIAAANTYCTNYSPTQQESGYQLKPKRKHSSTPRTLIPSHSSSGWKRRVTGTPTT